MTSPHPGRNARKPPSGRLLALGPDEGWHADQLRAAAVRLGNRLSYAPYESLRTTIAGGHTSIDCAAGNVADFDAVICRTMPSGTLEQITFRLASLHAAQQQGICVINPPRTLELAIDKFATLAIVASLGYRTPDTTVAQSRKDALSAFDAFGGDVVVKPIFGGEGRGVMRIQDRQLAWYTFSTLEQLGAVLYVQKFVPPGGRDTRMLIIGDSVFGIRRVNPHDFRTNVAVGARGAVVQLSQSMIAAARRIASEMSLVIGSVDVIDCEEPSAEVSDAAIDGVVVEVNAVPGWKGAQACFEGCLNIDLAETMISSVIRLSRPQ
jgi:RimK family alpha-L-glutamate ligase